MSGRPFKQLNCLLGLHLTKAAPILVRVQLPMPGVNHIVDDDRRDLGRITPRAPLQGRIGRTQVRILDISLRGSRISHEEPLPVGETCLLTFRWQDRPIEAWCEIVRSRLHAFGRSGHPEFHTGLKIVEAPNGSASELRSMITWHVTRALEAQKADAHGESRPPSSDHLEAVRVENVYTRCELLRGIWRKVTTSDPEQPPVGFTVRASEPVPSVDRLCRVYERTDSDGRRLIQRMAAVSLGSDAAVSQRRYVP